MSDDVSRELVRVKCRRKGHLLMALVATTDGRMQVKISHHPLFMWGPGPRAAGFDVGVWAQSEDDDPNSGPSITREFDETGLYPAHCQCAQHAVAGAQLLEALRRQQRVLLSEPGQ